jgi:hypothetical protein
MMGPNSMTDDWMRAIAAEFREVRPYFMGNFYPLFSYNTAVDMWAAWQFHRADWNSGCVICLRRPYSSIVSVPMRLKEIDMSAQYSVDIRYMPASGNSLTMSGADLANLSPSITERPGSAVVFYRRL